MSHYGTPTYYTSRIYPVQVIEQMTASAAPQPSVYYMFGPGVGSVTTEGINAGANLIGGTLASTLLSYTNGLPEGINAGSDLVSGTFTLALIGYTNGLPEGINAGADLISGTIALSLVTYSNWPTEGINAGADLISGTLV